MKIVITGVTRGLGRALVEEFIRAGHTVIGCGRSGEAIFDLRMTHLAPHDFSVVDVALDSKVAIWAAKVLENDSAPDLLLNNAAIMNRLSPVWEQDDREFTKLVDVNIRGTQNVLRHFVPAMVAKKKGVIDTDMLRSCWADGAASYLKAEQWAKTAAPFILKLGPKQNGQSLSVGGD